MVPKIGLALGGGGVRGLAHIGILKVLEREEVPVHCIAGTSMGGVIGAFYAKGMTVSEIEEEVVSIAGSRMRQFRLFDFNFALRGVFDGDQIKTYFGDLLDTVGTFDDLKIPFAVVSTDLNSGKEIHINGGNLTDALRSTISVAGFFTPVEEGPYKLVDGAYVNNVPADVARDLGADYVIAIDVMPNFEANIPGEPPVVESFPPPVPSLPMLKSLWQTNLVMVARITHHKLAEAKPEMILRPVIPADVTLFRGWSLAEEVIRSGELAAQNVVMTLRKLMQE